MSIVPKNEASTRPNVSRRRRKKRRTEDFSDSSDSSDSSSSDSESENEKEEAEPLESLDQHVDADGDVVLEDSEIQIEVEKDNFDDVKQKLKTVNLTKTALNQTTKNVDTNQVENILQRNRKELENEYLGLMFENYGDDINALRTAADFNESSLTILAMALKNGHNIFDEDTLKAVVKK
jgi:ribosome assembly protein 3